MLLPCGLLLFVAACTSALESPPFARIARANGGSAVRISEKGGLRGLVATRSADIGAVLLEVPLALCACDFGAEASFGAVEPPTWARDAELPWNVQLACSILARHEGMAAVLESFPEEGAPALPMASAYTPCTPLALASPTPTFLCVRLP